ncbi:MAG TPA: PQQ-binding-like beta-propeller repeat protein [Actinomycetaceae bacterium]|nr:PQQ-binding-like beta-propeller repeat protein [Actinomycetaceae bacterium]
MRWRRRRRNVVSVAACAALALTMVACSGQSSESPSPGATSSPTTTPTATEPAETAAPVPETERIVEPLWSVSGTFAGVKDSAGDVLVSYFVSGDELMIGAFRATDGASLWSAPAGVGHAEEGAVLEAVVVGEGDVAFLRPEDADGWARLAVADAATGATIAESELLWAETRPYDCGAAACVDGHLLNGARGVWELTADGRLIASTTAYLPENSRSLGELVFSTNDRPGEMLGLGHNGQVVWERPFEEVFGSGFSTDNGWSWDTVGSTLVGQSYQRSLVENRFDYLRQMVVGLNRETGATLWRFPASNLCLDVSEPLALCTFTSGQVDWDESGAMTVLNVNAVLNGVDAETGAVKWTVPLDRKNFFDQFGRPFLSPDGSAVRYVDGGVVEIDLVTGERTELSDGSRLACEAEREIPVLAVYRGTEHRGQVVGPVVESCSVDREPLGAGFSAAAVRAGGVLVGDVFVVTTAEGLQGFRP